MLTGDYQLMQTEHFIMLLFHNKSIRLEHTNWLLLINLFYREAALPQFNFCQTTQRSHCFYL